MGGTPSNPTTVIRNAERATTYGAEVEARFRAMADIDLFASAGLRKTKVNRYNDPAIEGNELPRAPAFAAPLAPIGWAAIQLK